MSIIQEYGNNYTNLSENTNKFRDICNAALQDLKDFDIDAHNAALYHYKDFDRSFESIPNHLNITNNIVSKLMLTEFEKEHNTSMSILKCIHEINSIMKKYKSTIRSVKKYRKTDDVKIIIPNLDQFKISYQIYFSKDQIKDVITTINTTVGNSSIRVNAWTDDEVPYWISVNNAIRYSQRYSKQSYESNKEFLKSYFFEMCNKLKEAKSHANAFSKRIKNLQHIEDLDMDKLKSALIECCQCCNEAINAFDKFMEVMNKLYIEHIFEVPSK